MTSKNFYFDQKKLLLWLIVFFANKKQTKEQTNKKKQPDMDRDERTKFNFETTVRLYNDGVGNIFRIGLRRFATPPNTEYTTSRHYLLLINRARGPYWENIVRSLSGTDRAKRASERLIRSLLYGCS